MKSKALLTIAANALNEKKALDLTALEIGDLTILADYFLIASATSSTHVRALTDEVEKKLKQAGVAPLRIEGRATGWMVMDYGDLVVHIFDKATREFYTLDRLWNEGKRFDLSAVLEQSEEDSH